MNLKMNRMKFKMSNNNCNNKDIMDKAMEEAVFNKEDIHHILEAIQLLHINIRNIRQLVYQINVSDYLYCNSKCQKTPTNNIM